MEALAGCGAAPILVPCVAIEINRQALASLEASSFDWLIITSQNAAQALPRADLPALKVFAVGEKTSKAAQTFLPTSQFITGDWQNAEEMAEQLAPDARGKRVLLLQGNLADTQVADTLRQAGAEVERLVVYHTLRSNEGGPILPLLEHRQLDAITFASPSAVRFFLERLIDEGGHLDLLQDVCIACLGSTTLKAAHEKGLKNAIAPLHPTFDALMARMEEYFREHLPDLPDL